MAGQCCDGTVDPKTIAAMPATSKTVLIIEDNALNLKLFEELLTIRGYRTLAATKGLTGVALAEQHRPEMIILDIQLPDISGFEVLRRIRGNPAISGTPILAITVVAQRGDRESILAGGCDRYMSKPFRPEEFLSEVVGMIGPAQRA